MRRVVWPQLSMVVAAGLALGGGTSHAANPKTEACLAASDASLQTHSLRSEREQLVVCAARTCPKDVRDECVSRLAEVTKKTPTLVFSVKGASGEDIDAVKVTMDLEVVATSLDGKPIPVEPGEHMFTFEALGQPKVVTKLTVREGEKDRRETIRLVPPERTAPLLAPAQSPSIVPTPTPTPTPVTGLGSQRIAALVLGGVGLVGLGIGASFGAVALAKKSSAESACPGTLCASQAGVDDWSGAHSAGNIATAGFIVLGVGAIGALSLWFTAPRSHSSPSPVVGLGLGSMRVLGTF
jgi:hypothetical protein